MQKSIKNIYPEPFLITGDYEDPRNLDFRLYGLHKQETFDSKGDLINVKFYKDYDATTGTFSNIAVEENRVYSRDINSGLPVSRVTNIDWYNMSGGIQTQKQSITKYYSAKKAFVANKRARENLIETASMYLFNALNQVDPSTAESNVEDFDKLTSIEQGQYIKSTTQPLLDIITNSTDSTNTEHYRSYITNIMRDTLLTILNIKYTQ